MSPDLPPYNYFLPGYLKTQVYSHRSKSLKTPKKAIILCGSCHNIGNDETSNGQLPRKAIRQCDMVSIINYGI